MNWRKEKRESLRGTERQDRGRRNDILKERAKQIGRNSKRKKTEIESEKQKRENGSCEELRQQQWRKKIKKETNRYLEVINIESRENGGRSVEGHAPVLNLLLLALLSKVSL